MSRWTVLLTDPDVPDVQLMFSKIEAATIAGAIDQAREKAYRILLPALSMPWREDVP